MKKFFYLLVAAIIFQACCVCNKMSAVDAMQFDKIVFHSSTCFGSCPQIAIEINREGGTKLKRQFFNESATQTKERSGEFKGHISKEALDGLMLELNHSNYETLQFPNVDCCDAPVITIIVYAKGKKVYLRSMMPPKDAGDLIKYLTELTTTVELPLAEDKFEIEN
ncbi:MAG: hypothetical protein IT251_02365 [Chitinophagaceae bacterium]|nr:hypothetical protein [Chitinophagaceae bacterium]